MKASNVLSLLVATLVAVNFALAVREDPLQIFPQLKRSRKTISGFADILVTAQSEVLLSEESFVKNSISDESALLNQLAGSDVQASGPECLDFIRKSVTQLLNLAGISYTNCFNDVDNRMFEELSKIPELALTRADYDKYNLLGVFRGENIFIDPVSIRNKLTNRMRAPINLPTVTPETEAALRTVFEKLKTNFHTCMSSAQTKLASNLQYTSQQVRAICAAEASKRI
ncbi:uncharacterized protein LOC131681935 [Topomyia yanbarensis]|uniref:uncharacterized protein LOC131681935 n=1 Tax=Topomyia yanbarensis TaxID=2498891 RepID=UPI00273C6181|nr:uncharacterized protein LOC131681935 [Topomyia yanbarensis]